MKGSGPRPILQQFARERVSTRHKVFEPVLLSIGSDGAELRAHLINISETGALVHAVSVPALADTVQLQIEESWIVARVMWLKPPYFGIAFGKSLSEDLLARLLRR